VQSNILIPPYRRPSAEAVDGTVDSFPSPVHYVGIDHRRLHVPMPEPFLTRADVLAIGQQMRDARVAQRTAVGRLPQSDDAGEFFDDPLPH
jgi:hypothetical protein